MKYLNLMMGVVFLAAAACWALTQTGVVTGDDQRWLLPIPWVLGGGVGLIALGLAAMQRSRAGGDDS